MPRGVKPKKSGVQVKSSVGADPDIPLWREMRREATREKVAGDLFVELIHKGMEFRDAAGNAVMGADLLLAELDRVRVVQLSEPIALTKPAEHESHMVSAESGEA